MTVPVSHLKQLRASAVHVAPTAVRCSGLCPAAWLLQAQGPRLPFGGLRCGWERGSPMAALRMRTRARSREEQTPQGQAWCPSLSSPPGDNPCQRPQV